MPSMKADVVDATPLEGDEKLPKMMGLQLLNVQETVDFRLQSQGTPKSQTDM